MDTRSFVGIALVTSVLSCGLLIPLWLVVGLVMLIVQLCSPPKKPEPPKIIQPSNEFASDWEFRLYEID